MVSAANHSAFPHKQYILIFDKTQMMVSLLLFPSHKVFFIKLEMNLEMFVS